MKFATRCLWQLRRRLERWRRLRFYKRADQVVERFFVAEADKLLLRSPAADQEWSW